MSSEITLHFVVDNTKPLWEAGIYEEALLSAYTMIRTSHYDCPVSYLQTFFRGCNREKLRAAGDPIPDQPPFTLYRGIAGNNHKRLRRRGISWTSDRERAEWFMKRYEEDGLYPYQELCKIVLPDDRLIFAYYDDRSESEYLVDIPRRLPLETIWRNY
jgi:hypothetical protein